MSHPNVSPLTDDRASFEHGKAAGQHAAKQLGATSPLSPHQLAWLNGFLDGLFSGSLLSGSNLSQPLEPIRLSDGPPLETPVRGEMRADFSREHSRLEPSEVLTRPDTAQGEPSHRTDALPRAEFGRGEPGGRFESAAPGDGLPPGSGSLIEGFVRPEGSVRFEPGLRAVSSPYTASSAPYGGSSEGPMSVTANENSGMPSNPMDLAAQVRATLATSGKRAANLGDEARSKYSADNPFAARIVQIISNQARNPSAWRLTLDVESSGLRCRPGDVLGVVPSNDPDLVRRLLRRLGAKGQETVTTARGTGPAWRALLEEFSITQVTKELLWVLASSTRNTSEARQLESVANSATHGSDIPLATVLRRFPGARPSLNDFVNSLCPLVPQYYPLASARSRQADTLEILAAKHPNETRSVVHQLHQEKLAQGDWLPVFVDSKPHVHPPTDISSPVILLAPGVGAACAFAFLAERAATRGSGRNWLFTSPIEGETEVAYAEHFAAWQTSRIIGRLDVSPTQQLGKRLFDHGEMVQAWVVDGSYLYIYGTKSDCHELEQALAQLLVMRARITQEEAHKRLDAMRTSGQLRVNNIS